MSTRGRLIGLRNKPQQKQTCQHLAVVYWQLVSLLMELSIDGEKCSLTWCVYISGEFWQSRSHIKPFKKLTWAVDKQLQIISIIMLFKKH